MGAAGVRKREGSGSVPRRLVRSRGGGPARSPHVQVSDIQRSRLLAAGVRAMDELGYGEVTVSQITHGARVSRRTFYELFANREECLCAIFDAAVERVRAQLAALDLAGLGWRERVRVGLWEILCFLEREPALARFCVVQSARGEQLMLAGRERVLAELRSIVNEGRVQSTRGADCAPLIAEGLVGATLSILGTRLARETREPLTGLLGELTGMIVLPYLGPAIARQERERPHPSLTIREQAVHGVGEDDSLAGDPLQGLSMRLTFRTARVLEEIAAQPGISNRTVGERAGMTDQGQTSKLLARLERYGLIENRGAGHAKGEANAWQLTTQGHTVAQTIAASNHYRKDDHDKA